MNHKNFAVTAPNKPGWPNLFHVGVAYNKT